VKQLVLVCLAVVLALGCGCMSGRSADLRAEHIAPYGMTYPAPQAMGINWQLVDDWEVTTPRRVTLDAEETVTPTREIEDGLNDSLARTLSDVRTAVMSPLTLRTVLSAVQTNPEDIELLRAVPVVGKATAPVVDPAAAPKPQIIYNGNMSLLVDDPVETLAAIRAATDQCGGRLDALTDRSITVKVPAALFHEFVEEVGELGDVLSRDIKGEDVSDKMRDLNIRLANAVEVRDRLAALLDKAEKVEDALAVEKELERVTEKIELIKGKLQSLGDRVAFSTLTVYVNSLVARSVITREYPFAWVDHVGRDMTAGYIGPSSTKKSGGKVKVDLPTGFATYYQRSYCSRAVSADEVYIKVTRETNYEGADLDFWTELISKSLRKKYSVKIDNTEELELRGRKKGTLLSGTRSVGTRKTTYMLCIAQSKKHVFLYEVWGPVDELEKAREAIVQSMETMRL
jgi:hypothetical protein